MKKALMFVGLFLFSVVFLSLTASAESFSNIKTEKITCVFNNLDKEELCASYFNSDDIYQLSQYSCSGKGRCSIDVRGKEGSIIKWRPMKWCDITDGKTPSAPGRTTTIDGTDKTIEFDCQHRTWMFSLLDTLGHFYYNLFQDRIGYKNLYYLCYDGTEGVVNIDKCKIISEGEQAIDDLCKDKCYYYESKGTQPACGRKSMAFDNCLIW